MKGAVKRSSRAHRAAATPRVTSEVRQIHRTLDRLESHLSEERSESRRVRRLNSNANNHYILGSTFIGLGLFLVSGLPMPSSASRTLQVGSQFLGVALGLVGLFILIRSYREWHATAKGSYSRHRSRLIALGVIGGMVVLVGLGFYAGFKVANGATLISLLPGF